MELVKYHFGVKEISTKVLISQGEWFDKFNCDTCQSVWNVISLSIAFAVAYFRLGNTLKFKCLKIYSILKNRPFHFFSFSENNIKI